ncbi:MAG: RHS repeat-associated core domain-containing protein, partial [Thermoplasmata archaeon]
DGNSSLWEYDAAGNMVSSRDPAGNVYDYQYDQIYRLVNFTDPMGNMTCYGYDNNDNIICYISPNGFTTTYEYDLRDRLTTITDPTGNQSIRNHDALGNIVSYTDRTGATWNNYYDLNGRLKRETDPLGNQTLFSFDQNGNVLNRTDRNGNAWQFTYDGLGQMTESTCPYGFSTLYEYDALGNLVTKEDALGQVTAFAYDALGRLTSAKSPMGHITNFTYDSMGNLLEVTNPRGFTTSYGYDNMSRISSILLPNGDSEAYAYDANGNLESRTDGEGGLTTYAYDALNRLVGKILPDDEVFVYAYDANGNLKHASRSYGKGNISLAYDSLDRIISESVDHGTFLKDITYDYDREGRPMEINLVQDGRTISYARDALGRLTSIFDSSGYTNFTYDAGGRNTEIHYADGSITTKAWNDADLIRNLTNTDPFSSPLSWFNYTYNHIGLVTDIQTSDGTISYDYNADRWITNMSGKDFYNYSWDPNGNLIGEQINSGPWVASSYDENDQLSSRGTATYDYDRNGNLAKKTEGASVTDYLYDADNHLVRINGDYGETAHAYGPLGDRIFTDNGTAHREFTYLFDNLVMESGLSGNLMAYYTFGDALDEPYFMEGGGQEYSYQLDGMGNVVSLLDSGGSVAAEYSYDAFGGTSRNGALENPFMFESRFYDADNGIYDFRARNYDPETARFMSRDPLGFESEYNLYLFCRNNPLKFNDPYGTACEGPFNTVEECLACVNAWEKSMLDGLKSPEELDQELEEYEKFVAEEEARHNRHMARLQQRIKDSLKSIRDSLAEIGAAQESLDSLDSAIGALEGACDIIDIASAATGFAGDVAEKGIGGAITEYGKGMLEDTLKEGAKDLVADELDHQSSGSKKKGADPAKVMSDVSSSLKNVDTDGMRKAADALTSQAKQKAGIEDDGKTPGDIMKGLSDALDTVLGSVSPAGIAKIPLLMLQQFFECWKPGQQVRMAGALYKLAGAIDDIKNAQQEMAYHQEAWQKQKDKYDAELNLMRRENREAKEHWNNVKAAAESMRAQCQKDKRGTKPVPPPKPSIPPGKPAVTVGREGCSGCDTGGIESSTPCTPNGDQGGWGHRPTTPGGEECAPGRGGGRETCSPHGGDDGWGERPTTPGGTRCDTGGWGEPDTGTAHGGDDGWGHRPTTPGGETCAPGRRGGSETCSPHDGDDGWGHRPTTHGGVRCDMGHCGDDLDPWGRGDIYQPHTRIYFPSPGDSGLENFNIDDGDTVLPGSHSISLDVENYRDTVSGPGSVDLELYKWGRNDVANDGFEAGVTAPWFSEPLGEWVNGSMPHTGMMSAMLMPGSIPDRALIYDVGLDIQSMEEPVLSFWFTTAGPMEPMMIEVRASLNGGAMPHDFTEVLHMFDPSMDSCNNYAASKNIDLSGLSEHDDIRIGFFSMMPTIMSELHIDDFAVTESGWKLVTAHSEPVPEIDPDEGYTITFPSYTFEDGEKYMAAYSLEPEDEMAENNHVVAQFECGELNDVAVTNLMIDTLFEEPPLRYHESRTMQATIANLGNMLADNVDITAHMGHSLTLFDDEMEEGPTMWTMTPPTPNWNILEENAYSPPNGWACTLGGNAYGEMWLESLTANPVDLSDPNMKFAKLSFFHSYDLEMNGGIPADGANIKVSTDGVMWDVVTPACGYDGELPMTGDNMMEGQEVFSGTSDYHMSEIDLTPYIGNPQVRVRFEMGTDGMHTTNSGWFIDDVEVSALIEHQTIAVETPIISLPGSQSGDYCQPVSTLPFTFPGAGEWTVWIAATSSGDDDFSNNLAALTIITTSDVEITLQKGWNLISIPQEMADTSVESVLSSIAGCWDVVKWYDGQTKQWKTYRVGISASTLDRIDHEMGLWLRTTSACNLAVSGTEPGTTSITLYAGWNLVGYPTLTGGVSAFDALAGTGADMIGVYTSDTPYVQDITDLGSVRMMPGDGYWVRVPADTAWIVDW